MKPDKLRESITANDVAELAGVSRWTVNRAFKTDASISSESRRKVLEAANQLGYTPDLIAASLASDRSNLVSLLIDDFSNPHKLVMMERLTRILRHSGWGTLLVNTLDADDAALALVNARQHRVDAAVLIGSQFSESILAAAGGARQVKKLILFARYSADPGTISVCCDDEAAMESIADHVISRGYCRPVFVAGPQTQSAHVMRKETFLKRWQEARGEQVAFTVVETYDPQIAYRQVTRYLSGLNRSEWPDILVCENDALAMGAVDAIRYEFGLHVPDDIAVTGFDDTPVAANPNYRLTTYRQPITAMAEGLVGVLKGEYDADSLSHFVGRLVVRESA
ncbi:putative HTH-type transcriptional repressor ExuR [Granulosicoccus antarcticus IMCC3135]|uniref:Putative HTH-type transcriptional repressor ExuR n=2 Tax=Granulosicoccus TaxID=437504 RepID=A0A2Z2NZX2_9GAMM|nr:putative HTH-type transcriptional repressor ExuR [Granulosicoccus antarcticus IMCC3135]